MGHKCAAYFTEDGLLYNAVIKSIDAENFSCVVKYIGKGEEGRERRRVEMREDWDGKAGKEPSIKIEGMRYLLPGWRRGGPWK